MSDFSAKRALLAGPDLARRRPVLIALWLLLSLIMALIAAWTSQVRTDALHASASAGRFAGPALGPWLWMLFAQAALFLVVNAVMWSSAFRGILRPQERGPARLGFGRAEINVLAAQLLTTLMAALPLMLMPLIAIYSPLQAKPWLAASSPLVWFIGSCAAIWSAVAGVWAFDRGEIAPFRCWTSTRGHFWKLAGLCLAVLLAQIVLRVLPGEVMAGSGLQSTGRVDLLLTARRIMTAHPALNTLGSPATLLLMVYDAVLAVASIAFMAGIVTTAYRANTTESTPD